MRILITGASGQLGAYLLHELRGCSHEVSAWSGSRCDALHGFPLLPVDLTRPETVVAAYRAAQPQAVIHAAAVAGVGACHAAPDHARAVNEQGTAALAALAADARFVAVSTDLVFDGDTAPYAETALPQPLSVYGRSKRAAENACPASALTVRLSLLFGPSLNGRPSFFDQQLQALRQRTPLKLFDDEWRTPLSLKTAARALLALATSRHTGRLHLGGPERMSRLEMGQRLAAFLGHDPSVFVAARRDDVPAPEPRPRDTSLSSARWRSLFPDLPWPGFEDALREMHVV